MSRADLYERCDECDCWLEDCDCCGLKPEDDPDWWYSYRGIMAAEREWHAEQAEQNDYLHWALSVRPPSPLRDLIEGLEAHHG